MDPLCRQPRVDARVGQVLGRQGGVAAGWQLREVGLGVDALKARVKRGVLVRIDRGVYAARGTTT